MRIHGVTKSPFADKKPISRRKRPNNAAKLEILVKLRDYMRDNVGSPRIHFIRHIGYASSTVSDWTMSTRLAMVASLPECASFKRLRNIVTADRASFRVEQDLVFENFLYRRRSKGQEVDYEWLRHEFKTILKDSKRKPEEWKHFMFSNGWIAGFIDHYNISSQIQTEKKPVSNAVHVPLLQTFHTELCLLQQGEGTNVRDPFFGRFSPLYMWNVDQIPLSFIKSKRSSLNPRGEACWVVNHGPDGLHKRMATIVLTLRAEGEQIVPPFILFRGDGYLDPEILAELDAQGIPYGFNKKAWATGEACVEYLRFFAKIVKAQCPEAKEHMLLLDGLSAQATKRFVDLAIDLNILPVYFPPNCTHLVQPVDHRVAAWIKQAWHTLYLIDEEKNYEAWNDYRNNGSLCLQLLRITILKWMWFIWDQLKKMTDFLLLAFLSTGCLITLKGEHQIKFHDIPNYVFPFPELAQQ